MHRWPASIFDGDVQCISARRTSASFSAACHYHAIDQETTSRCGGREELQAGLQPHFRLQGGWAIGIGAACRLPAGEQSDASWTVGVSEKSFNWDSVAPGHLRPPQLHGQTRGNAARTSRSQCRVRLCRSWHPAVTTGADVWHWGVGNRMDTILPGGPDAASGIPWSAVWHPETGFRRPTRFRAWSTTVPALHGRVAGHYQGPRYEGALLCRWHAGTCQHWSRGRRDGCPKVRQLHGEDPILDEQQQTEDECRQNAGDMDRIQTTACQSRHQGVPAAVCQHSIFHHSVQSRCSSRQSAHHAGSCGGNVPLVLLSAEAAADYPEFIDNRCCQDVGTGVCRRSAWLL